MLLFLLFPSYFLNSPIARQEYHLLKKRGSKRLIVRVAFVSLILILITIATYPLRFYMGLGTAPQLIFLIGSIYLFHLGVILWGLAHSSRTISREMSNGHWEELVLTGIDARQIIIGKWCACVITILPIFMLVGLLKLGPAYGMAQHLHQSFNWNNPIYGNVLLYSDNYSWIMESPNFLKTATSAVILLAYSVAEAGLIAALGILGAFAASRMSSFASFFAVLLRGSVIIIGLAMWFGVAQQVSEIRGLYNEASYYSSLYVSINDWQGLLQSAQMISSSLVDSGMIITTYLMRPTGTHFHILQASLYAASGLLLFAGLTWLSLRIAQILAVRLGALAPKGAILNANPIKVGIQIQVTL